MPLKGVISEAAKSHDRSPSEEIRDALQTHYKQDSATATKKDIQDAILEHVTGMHSSLNDIIIKYRLKKQVQRFHPQSHG